MKQAAGLRVIFAGTPEFAAHHLRALINSHHKVISVYTQPDRPSGRGKKLQASPVKQCALDANIEVQQPKTLKDSDAQAILKEYNADIMVVVAYGLLLPKEVLDTPKLGCINVHGSILPRWRGAAPIQRAIEAGDDETGITIMQMDIGLDTGDMLLKVFCPIRNDDTAGQLHDRLAEAGPPALLSTLEQFESDTTAPKAQDNAQATYAHKLTKKEAQLDWSLSADILERRIRAFNPFPIATTLLGEDRIRIHAAQAMANASDDSPGTIIQSDTSIVVACGNKTSLCIEKLQIPGKKALTSQQTLNGSGGKFHLGAAFSYEQSADRE